MIFPRPKRLRPIVGKNGTIKTIYAIYLPTGQTAFLTSQQFDDVFINGGPKADMERKNKYVHFQMVNGIVQPIDLVPSKPISLAQIKTQSRHFD